MCIVYIIGIPLLSFFICSLIMVTGTFAEYVLTHQATEDDPLERKGAARMRIQTTLKKYYNNPQVFHTLLITVYVKQKADIINPSLSRFNFKSVLLAQKS